MTLIADAPNMQRHFGKGSMSIYRCNNRICLDRLYQSGNAKIRIPKRHQSQDFEAVMINTSGGMTGGDHMVWCFEAKDGANVTVTTQACDKIYKSTGASAQTDIELKVGDGTHLNWLPQETILYNRSNLKRNINVNLCTNSTLLMVEALVWGRQAMGETIHKANLADHWRIYRDGKLAHAECFNLNTHSGRMLENPAILGNYQAMATLVLMGQSCEHYLPDLKVMLGANGGVSFWEDKLVVRVATEDSYTLRKVLIRLVGMLSKGSSIPKYWNL